MLMHIDIPKEELQAAFTPSIRRQVVGDDEEWDAYVASAKPTIFSSFGHFLRRLRGKGRYEKKWSAEDVDKVLKKRFNLAGGDAEPILWGTDRYIAFARGKKRIHLLYLMRLIEMINPKSVLEVGSGTGANLFILAARYPEISFTGVELTSAGHKTAEEIRSKAAMPPQLASFSPLPIKSQTAHQSVTLLQGNAQSLPFANKSFDLVFTIQALEQMESIRAKALGEIARVCTGHVAMFEPFSEWNSSPERRHGIAEKNLFNAASSDLTTYGLQPVLATDNMPTKLSYGVGLVVAKPL